MQAPRKKWYLRYFRPRFVISIFVIIIVVFEFCLILKIDLQSSILPKTIIWKDMDSKDWKRLTDESTYDNIELTLSNTPTVNFYPSNLLHSSISTPFRIEESAFYVDLLGRCTDDRESIVHISRVKNTNDLPKASIVSQTAPDLLEKLRDCTEFDVYLPAPLRQSGYCEDGIAYVRGLQARLMPGWVFEKSFYDSDAKRYWRYNELCPDSVLIFFNHYWDGIPDAPDFPKSKPIYLMPNVEMFELSENLIWRTDAIFCKTFDGYLRIRKWYKQEGNPKRTKLFYTRHTTTDIAAWAHYNDEEDTKIAKDFKSLHFTHTSGSSVQKNTRYVCECWLRKPEFPDLHVYLDPGNMHMLAGFEEQIFAAQNIHLHRELLSTEKFAQLIAQSVAFICPSKMEGYGHYINQARASGGVIMTTDYPPMNELISAESGVMVLATSEADDSALLGGGFTRGHGLRDVRSSIAHVTWQDICNATQLFLENTNDDQRLVMAEEAKLRYAFDTRYFLYKMNQVKEYARNQMKKRKI